jgi:Holliday junction resolvase-like predicted endonuclease
MKLRFEKSSRHAKITGDFGESLILYWLSKHGYESARVDHTGIDIIARHPRSQDVLGISVKTRSRAPGTERTAVNISLKEFDKVKEACRTFRCVPYFALVVDAGTTTWAFLLPMKRLSQICTGQRVAVWQMGESHLRKYYADRQIVVIELNNTRQWQ